MKITLSRSVSGKRYWSIELETTDDVQTADLAKTADELDALCDTAQPEPELTFDDAI